jgi:uncharacterized protein (DUF2336 family)
MPRALVKEAAMSSELSMAAIVARLEAQIEFHREREAFHMLSRKLTTASSGPSTPPSLRH